MPSSTNNTTQAAPRASPSDMLSSVPAIAAMGADTESSSDLELHTDSSSSGGSPRMPSAFVSHSGSPDAVALLALFELSDYEDKSDDMTASHVIIKPNLKLMSNSERGKYYRRKRKNYAEELSISVNKLRRQVAALVAAQQLRQELVVGHRQTPFGSLGKLVKEYCAQFEYGTPIMMTPTIDSRGGTMQLSRMAVASSQQARFLHASMEECVGFGELVGIRLLLGQWERYSKYHAALRFELKSLDVVSPTENEANEEPVLPVIVVRADLHVRYSLETIEQVFPHLLDDTDLVQELVGLEVTYPCVNTFYFSASGKIERYNPEVDFMSALATKIRSMAGVAHVLSHALISKDHLIGVLDEDADISHSEPQVEYDDYEDTEANTMSDWKASAGANVKSEAPYPTSPVVIKSKPTSRLDLDFILS